MHNKITIKKILHNAGFWGISDSPLTFLKIALLTITVLTVISVPVSAATVDWSYNQGDNSEYLTVTFTGTISGANATSGSQWVWNFGDGTTGTGQTPTHTYGTPSSTDDLVWTVTLDVTTDTIDGSEEISATNRDITLVEPTLDAIYTTNPADGEGDAPLTATFTDTTFGRHDIISWDFGDGSEQPTTSTVTHTYETPGTYTITLTVNRDDAEDSWSNELIVSEPVPVPLFHVNVTSGKTPLSVKFTDDSSITYGSIIEWSWDFGDGYTSTEQNPVHTYNDVGSYDVKLTVTSDEGKSDSVTDTDCIVTEEYSNPEQPTNHNYPVVRINSDSSTIQPGETLYVSADVMLSAGDDEKTFPSSGSLEVYTELENPHWIYYILVDGHGSKAESYSKRLEIPGYLLSYSSCQNEVSIKYRLSGVAPTVSEPEDKEIFRISQLNEDGETITGSETSCKRTIDNTAEPEPPGIPATTGSPLINVSPDNWELLPDEEVTVNAEIHLTGSEIIAFPSSHSIEAFTELNSPLWEYSIIINEEEIQNFCSDSWLVISGYDLSYPSALNNVSVKYKLKGNAPDIKGPIIKTIFEVNQLDGAGNIVSPAYRFFVPENILEERIINETAIISPIVTPTPTPTPSPSPTATPTPQPPQTDYPEITSGNEKVLYGCNFTAEFSGKKDTDYIVWFAGTSDMTNTDGDKPPSFAPNQSCVTHDLPDGPYTIGNYSFRFGNGNVSSDVPKVYGSENPDTTKYGKVRLDSEGNATVVFTTENQTKINTYTLRMEWLNPETGIQEYDTARIQVTRGGVSIKDSGAGSCYLGDEVIFSGKNTDTKRIYLFITGPNLPPEGGMLDNPQKNYNPELSEYSGIEVNKNNTWEYCWETTNLPLDAGTYTVYAASEPVNKQNLSNAEYSSTVMVIKKPFITLNYENRVVYTGDNLEISGTATGSPPDIALWLIGDEGYKNYTVPVRNLTSEFGITIPASDILSLGNEGIYAVAQHPMYNHILDVYSKKTGEYTYITNKLTINQGIDNCQFIIDGPGRLKGEDAADALTEAINSPDIDDSYVKAYYTVQEKGISLDFIYDQEINSTFTITGTANSESTGLIYFDILNTKDSVPVLNGSTYITKTDQNTGIFTISVNTTGITSGKYVINVTLAEEPYCDYQVFYIKNPADSTEKPVLIQSPAGEEYTFREKVTIYGINNQSDTTYLFLAGKSITSGGVNPEFPNITTKSGDESTFIKAPTGENGVWAYTWRPSEYYLTPGSYRIFAVSEPVTQEDFINADFDSAEIKLLNPSVSGEINSLSIAKGDPLEISGTATGSPEKGIAVWILGKNYWNGAATPISDSKQVTTTVQDNESFEYIISAAETENLAAGNYFVVLQHPMYNGRFDITAETENDRVLVEKETIEGEDSSNPEFIIWGTGKLQGSDATNALTDCISSPDVDDTYTKLTFSIEEPWIRINSIVDHVIGDNFSICGTTNLAVDNDIIVEVTSSSFQPTQKTTSGEFSGASATVKVTKGETYNEWSMDLNTSGFIQDEYVVKVESFDTYATAVSKFDLYSGSIPTPTPTPVPGLHYSDGKIILNHGWNFISTPKRLDSSNGNNTAGKLFGDIDSGGHSALMYNATSAGWETVKTDTTIKPLDALWIYSNSTGNKDIALTFDPDPLQTPPSKHLSAGWNMLGYSSTKPATARDTLIDVSGKWTKIIGWNSTIQNFEDTIISGGSGVYSDSRTFSPGNGYWLWMKEEGTIASMSINSEVI